MSITSLLSALPGAVAQGLIWGIMAIGVNITYKVLDYSDLTVDGTMATGGAVCVMLMINGVNVWISLICAVIAGMLAGLVTGIFKTKMGIPAILSGILTQLALYSINLWIMGFKANQGINVTKYNLIVSARNVRHLALDNPIIALVIITAIVIVLLYWFFGTELGCSLRATGCNVHMAKAQGINVDHCTRIGLMLSNGIVTLSSALFAQYQGSVGLKLVGVSLGAVIYYIVIQVVLWLGLNTNLLKLLSALIVALFLAIPYWTARYSQKHVKGAH